MKALKEQAEMAGVDLSNTFAELSENMTTKERKTLSKNLGVKIPNRTKEAETTSNTQTAQQLGSFGNITTNSNAEQTKTTNTNNNFF